MSKHPAITSRSSQRGAVLLLAVALMTIIATAAYAAIIASVGAATAENNKRHQKEWLEQAARQLSEFYATHAKNMDASSGASWSAGVDLARAAGVQLRYRAKLEIGARQSAGQLKFRNLTLWIPNATTNGSSGFSASRARAFKVINGQPVERDLLNEANKQLSRISETLTAYYAGRIAADPAHNAAVNYWQPAGCGPNGAGDWGCRSSWQSLGALADSTIGLADGDLTNPWGYDLQGVNTGAAVEQTNPPFTMVIRTRFPWGGAIESTVIQPLGSA